MIRRCRKTLADLLASLGLLGSLGAVLALMLAAGDGGGGDGGSEGGEGGEGGSSSEGGSKGGESSTGQTNVGEAGAEGKVEFTKEQQAEIDRIIADAKTKAADKAKKDAEAEHKQAAERVKMDEAERLKAEKADAEKAAADKVTAANARIVKAEARALAASEGVKADQLATFLKLVDLDGVDVGDDGEPDSKAIGAAIAKTLKDETIKVAFTGTANGKGRSGGQMNGGGTTERAKTIEDAVAARLAS